MEIRFGFERLLAHDHWANGEALRSLEGMKEPPAKALELMGHLMGAEVAWILRMTEGRDPEEWEDWEKGTLPWLRRAWREDLPPRWTAFLGNAVLAEPSRAFSYRNFLGETREARVEDVVTQLMLHSAYHRGQVGTMVRAAGGEPAVVDFLHAARNGLLPDPKAPRVDR